MVILSVKAAELDPDLWKPKARIVFRGDSVTEHQLSLRSCMHHLLLRLKVSTQLLRSGNPESLDPNS